MDLLQEARDLHQALLQSKLARETQRLQRERAFDQQATPLHRYEQETFDITSSDPPSEYAGFLTSDNIPRVVAVAAKTVGKYVFGDPPKPWMLAVIDILSNDDSVQLAADLVWWQSIIDHINLRTARLVLSKARALPVVKSLRKQLMMEADFAQVSLDMIADSNCIPEPDGDSDLDDYDDDDADVAEIMHRTLQKARRASMENKRRSSADDAPTSATATFAAPTHSSSDIKPRRARSKRSRHRSRKGRVNSNGLHAIYTRMSRGYTRLFVAVIEVASQNRLFVSRGAVRGGRAPPGAGAELTTRASLRDRACSYMRAVLIETVATLFHQIYEGSDSLKEGLMLHHMSLRERIARTIDELMFGSFAPPGMLVWAPCTVGLDEAPALPVAEPVAFILPEPEAVPLDSRDATACPSAPATTTPGKAARPPLPNLTLPSLASDQNGSPTRTKELKRSQLKPLQVLAPGTQHATEVHEWSSAIREQISSMLSSMDSRSRLNLLMPTKDGKAPETSRDTARTDRSAKRAPLAQMRKSTSTSVLSRKPTNAPAPTEPRAAAPRVNFSEDAAKSSRLQVDVNRVVIASPRWHLSSPTMAASASDVKLRKRVEAQIANAPTIINSEANTEIQRALVAHRRKNSVIASEPQESKPAAQASEVRHHGNRRGSTSSILSTLGPVGLDGTTLGAKAVTNAMAQRQQEKARRNPAAVLMDINKRKKNEELRALAEEFRQSSADDVPLASASFVYSPLILSALGHPEYNQHTAAAPVKLPRAMQHAVTMRLTDPPAALASCTLHISDTPQEAATTLRSAIVQATTIGADKAKPPTNNYFPTLNLFLMSQLQQLHYDNRMHAVRSSSALLPRPNTTMRRTTRSRSPEQTTKDSNTHTATPSEEIHSNLRPQSSWTTKRPPTELRRSTSELDSTFMTGVGIAETVEEEDTTTTKPQENTLNEQEILPPVLLPITLFSNIDISRLLEPKHTNKPATEKSNFEIEYGLPADTLKMTASTPALVKAGTKRTLSSVTSLLHASTYEDKLHEALQQYTEASAARQVEMIKQYREHEAQAKTKLSELQRTTTAAIASLQHKRDITLRDDALVKQLGTRISDKRHFDFLRIKAEMNPSVTTKTTATSATATATATAAPSIAQFDAVEAAALGLTEDDINRIQADALRSIQLLGKKQAKRAGMSHSSSAPDLGITNESTLRRLKRDAGAAIMGNKSETRSSAALLVMESIDEGDDEESFRWIEKFEGGGLREAQEEREFRKREAAARAKEAEEARRRASASATDDMQASGAMASLTASILESENIEGTRKYNERQEVVAEQDRKVQDVLRRRRFELGSTFDSGAKVIGFAKQNSASANGALVTAKKLGISVSELPVLKHSVDKRRLRDAILLQRKQQTDMFRAAVSAKPKDSLIGAKVEIGGVTTADIEQRLSNLRRVSSMVQRSAPISTAVFKPTEGSKLRDIAASADHDRDLMKFDTIGLEALHMISSSLVPEHTLKG